VICVVVVPSRSESRSGAGCDVTDTASAIVSLTTGSLVQFVGRKRLIGLSCSSAVV
jgi:hypothetical protein